MRISNVKFLLLLLPSLIVAASELHIRVDDSSNGLAAVRTMVEHVVDKLPGQPRFKKQEHDTRRDSDAHMDQRDLLVSPRGILDGLLTKRQNCSPGFGYCRNAGSCCPNDNKCCSFGYCLKPGTTCCPSGPCDGDENCCGKYHCSPVGGDCCRDGSFCEPGNNCILWSGRIVCCTDVHCTAHVDNGITSYASTRTTTRTYSYASTRYYYWTVSYWYWYYYWTYSIRIEASTVTSSRVSTTTVLSILTTDANAASEYFSSISGTMVLSTPSEATSLEALVGRTTVIIETDSRDSEPPLPTRTGPPSIEPLDGNSNITDSAARAMWSSLDGFMAAFLAFNVGVGVIAAML
ncbi:hypothetical protein CEP54_016345 [Fusarium duplospermum]|uniref:Uncharacterized protein n=1 Tax=Fusarium duplospermum TaxID=1325734 RepID=A0A428NEP7_9HYPO|nr:hypothetical protein CEP54_016345 [Fusarium duplospermum]